jgi:hypothetical protein
MIFRLVCVLAVTWQCCWCGKVQDGEHCTNPSCATNELGDFGRTPFIPPFWQ